LAGGTHHAQVDEPSGFCIFNDLALATVHLLDDQANHLKRILIFDVDVHQGDGTARLLEDVDGAFTCSIHCQKNFPFRKAQSDVDVGCEVGMRDEAYLKMVEATLLDCMDRFRPNLMFYDAGVDVYGKDKLGKLMISLKGIRLRDRLVLDVCKSRQIPVATVIGGGYDENGDALARRHAICIEEAHRLWC
jgi:acetoin utilization deacetylase AcuC-like enzyme